MHELRVAVVLFVLLTVLGTIGRAVRGPTLADRILVAQIFGTSAVAILLMLACDPGRASLRDIALVIALLAAVTVIAFVRVVDWRERRR